MLRVEDHTCGVRRFSNASAGVRLDRERRMRRRAPTGLADVPCGTRRHNVTFYVRRVRGSSSQPRAAFRRWHEKAALRRPYRHSGQACKPGRCTRSTSAAFAALLPIVPWAASGHQSPAPCFGQWRSAKQLLQSLFQISPALAWQCVRGKPDHGATSIIGDDY